MQPQSAASFLLPDPRSLFRAFGDLTHIRAKIPPFLPLNQSMQRTSPCFYFAVKVPFARQMVQKVHLNNSTGPLLKLLVPQCDGRLHMRRRETPERTALRTLIGRVAGKSIPPRLKCRSMVEQCLSEVFR